MLHSLYVFVVAEALKLLTNVAIIRLVIDLFLNKQINGGVCKFMEDVIKELNKTEFSHTCMISSMTSSIVIIPIASPSLVKFGSGSSLICRTSG